MYSLISADYSCIIATVFDIDNNIIDYILQSMVIFIIDHDITIIGRYSSVVQSSKISLFANDSKVLKIIKSPQDSADFNKI